MVLVVIGIPTKAMLNSAKVMDNIKKAKRLGIEVSEAKINFEAVIKAKDRTVMSVVKGIQLLVESYGIEVIKGTGELVDKNKVQADGKELETENIIIATGSEPIELPFLKFDHDKVIDSKDALELKEVPETLAVIGGGVIGVELGTLYSKLGSKVTIIEAMPRILATEDKEISETLKNILKRNSVDVLDNTKVESADVKDKVELKLADGNIITADKVLVAVGRKPSINDEKLSKIGIEIEKGIKVNSKMRTSVDNIYAIGDVVNTPMLAHVAYAEAEVAADNIMGKNREINYNAVPNAIFTIPEIASVGIKEGAVGKFPFSASGRAKTLAEIDGFVKVYAKDNKIVGACMIGPEVSEILGEASLAISAGLTIDQIENTIHAHPTLSEAFFEAVKDLKGESGHLPKK
ncbi:dihydrolipoyl dehydrogenase [Nanoarchaeota archaeon]